MPMWRRSPPPCGGDPGSPPESGGGSAPRWWVRSRTVWTPGPWRSALPGHRGGRGGGVAGAVAALGASRPPRSDRARAGPAHQSAHRRDDGSPHRQRPGHHRHVLQRPRPTFPWLLLRMPVRASRLRRRPDAGGGPRALRHHAALPAGGGVRGDAHRQRGSRYPGDVARGPGPAPDHVPPSRGGQAPPPLRGAAGGGDQLRCRGPGDGPGSAPHAGPGWPRST